MGSPTSPGSAIIVGAGPAGASLAFLLASRGIPATLLERQHDFSREFRGEVLLPGGLDALAEMKLDGILSRIPHTSPTSLELYANAKLVFRSAIDPDFIGPRPPTVVSQPPFLEAVIGAASRYPNFTVELGATVTGLVRADGRVRGVVLREREILADLVIGADGRSSAVRRACNLPVRKHGLDVDVVWFKVPMPEFTRNDATVRAYVGRAHLLIAYRSADDLLQVAWVIHKGTYGELRERGISEWVGEMARHVSSDLAGHLRAHAGSLTRPFLLSAVSDRVTRWSIPGALVIGDAAHTMSPVGGQGINIALRDALVAANHLVPALGGTPTPEGLDAAASAIEAARTPEVAYIQRLQALPPRFLMGETWWASAFRAVLPRLLGFGLARRRSIPVVRAMLFGQGDAHLEV
jgi:2-polyprenyl-6-methoxyphenol hydroxylase-like FAD-dependent oxidoreductase